MSLLFDAALTILAALLAVPCLVFCGECLIGALFRNQTRTHDARAREASAPRPRIGVLVPAHDEHAVITRTLAGLVPELREGDVLLVVADNCSDDTAELARAAGARAVERTDAERRGKGYALAFGLDQLAVDPPDVVVIIDADCAVNPGSLERIARLAVERDRPVQADYLLQPPENPHGLTVVSALAFIVKNRVRPRGLHALGLPCLLTGTGMAFPWHVIRMAPPTESHLVEDMVMGLDLACLGHAPLLCPDAYVTSELPERTQAAHSQRRRWEHGHLATMIDHCPRLLRIGLLRARFGLIALALDLAVPPLSLLLLSVVSTCGVTFVAALLGASVLPFAIASTSLVLVVTGVLVAWLAFGRQVLQAKHLMAIPLYVLWKLPLYFSFLTRGRHGTWERTERKEGDAPNESDKPA